MLYIVAGIMYTYLCCGVRMFLVLGRLSISQPVMSIIE